VSCATLAKKPKRLCCQPKQISDAPTSRLRCCPGSITRPTLLLIINGYDGISCRRAAPSENLFQEMFAVLSLRLPLRCIFVCRPKSRRLRLRKSSQPQMSKDPIARRPSLIDSVIHLPCFEICNELQRMPRNLHAGSAASAPHSKRVLRGSAQHHRPGCGGLTMLLRWHSDESTIAETLCMQSMNLKLLFAASGGLQLDQGSDARAASSGVRSTSSTLDAGFILTLESLK
jgi:hypothetical protein